MDSNGDLSTIPSELAEIDGITIKPKDVTDNDVGKIYRFCAKLAPTTLTITNSVDAGTAIPEWVIEDQGFIYKIEGIANTATAGYSLTVAVPVGESQTILGLPLGEYTITVENWSWRYEQPKVDHITNGTFTVDETAKTLNFNYDIPRYDTNNGYYITGNSHNDPTSPST